MAKIMMEGEDKVAIRVGARVRKIREMRHISQLQLAEMVGIRSGPLGWIERGQHIPSGRVLYRIAKALNISIDDLVDENNNWRNGKGAIDVDKALKSFNMFPPLVIESAANDEETVESTCLVCKSFAFLLGKILLLQDSLPTLPFNFSTPLMMSDASAEQAASMVRHYIGLGDNITSDYVQVLEAAGLNMIFMELPEGIPAMSGYNPDSQRSLIFVNTRMDRYPERQIFAMAMEMGRLFWQVNAMAAETRGAFKSSVRLDELTFSRRFAMYFLMPTAAILRTFGALGVSPETWSWELFLYQKYRYSVSARCMMSRLSELPLNWYSSTGSTSTLENLLNEFERTHSPNEEPGGHREVLFVNERLSSMLFIARTRKLLRDNEMEQLQQVIQQTRAKIMF